eukprot:TRINITY_DN309_c5_g1_i1.p3 TRINITY_DN309_c5_g1~~TRINITY_DN309_c5_g1_i1.p3  ORF type:complete len:102 (+),score=3.90 TRINITY_DN309_c5_g1_i1:438-743(+)
MSKCRNDRSIEVKVMLLALLCLPCLVPSSAQRKRSAEKVKREKKHTEEPRWGGEDERARSVKKKGQRKRNRNDTNKKRREREREEKVEKKKQQHENDRTEW